MEKPRIPPGPPASRCIPDWTGTSPGSSRPCSMTDPMGLALVSMCPDGHRRFGHPLVHRLIEEFIHFNPILHQFYESFADSGLLVDPGQYLLGLGDIRNHEIEEAVFDIT